MGVQPLRRRLPVALTLAAALIGSLLLVPPAEAAPSRDRYALGDSVMLGARTALKSRGFRVDATTSRQAYSAPALLKAKGAKLPENVVVHLGTNGTFPLATCKRVVKVAGPQRHVFLVTVYVPRSWEKSNNATIRKCAKSFPDGRVTVIDWNSLAQKHPAWFYKDHTHLKPTGAAGFARLLDSAVDEVMARSQSTSRGPSGPTQKASILGASGAAKVSLNP